MPRSDLMEQGRPRRFQLVRRDDTTGVSGTGIIVEGLEHRDGSVQYHWLTSPGTWQMAESMADVRHIHGHGGKTTVRYLDDPRRPRGEKTRPEVYEDRNLLALAFAAIVDDVEGYESGWRLTEDDDADADQWAIVWADTPAGQVSWHVPRELVDGSTVAPKLQDWDGHNRAEKNQRLIGLANM